ncbi:hypothetical protein QE430_003318 [Microbacterium testaceum]|uniref:DUF6226 family protein n=1 Tax=Microbacterium testaceum TaxID=2033 RepID=UPI00278624A5|nr:DUF6226 family protein [Microbacterium testaceum]MDQ1175011.1 hypothetical protein [Microbacterium testaceum]
MQPYSRPLLEAPTFRDADGRVIEYGSRWEGSPPEETYSVDTHPERFAPLHVVADALVAHLGRSYDVAVVGFSHVANDLLHSVDDMVRAVRVSPSDPACATLTFVYTSYPGVLLHAGILHDFYFPACGCDACDSTWESEAENLERCVFAVVEGGYRENVTGVDHPHAEHAFDYGPDGSSSGEGPMTEAQRHRLESAEPQMRYVAGAWAAWPLRQSRD